MTPCGPMRCGQPWCSELREQGAIRTEPVAAAFAVVPRHLFAPGESLEAAYAAQGIVMAKRDRGRAGAQRDVGGSPPGGDAGAGRDRARHAGAGGGVSGGYNAALIQELVGRGGQVTTVDIDPDITGRARACLDAAGYEQVNVVLADAEDGVPGGAPYDRIIVTAGAWDLPPAWISQLSTGRGRLVVPLRMRGLTRSIAFDRDGAGWSAAHYCLARFVPVQGGGAYDERKVMLRDGIALQTDDPALRLDAAALSDALDAPRLECWPGAAWDLPDELEPVPDAQPAACLPGCTPARRSSTRASSPPAAQRGRDRPDRRRQPRLPRAADE